MRELTRSNDPIRLSWLESLLADQGIEVIIFDAHTSVIEGSINAIARRIMVVDDDFIRACSVLDEFGETYTPVPRTL